MRKNPVVSGTVDLDVPPMSLSFGPAVPQDMDQDATSRSQFSVALVSRVVYHCWLVVEPPTPLKNDGLRQLGS